MVERVLLSLGCARLVCGCFNGVSATTHRNRVRRSALGTARTWTSDTSTQCLWTPATPSPTRVTYVHISTPRGYCVLKCSGQCAVSRALPVVDGVLREMLSAVQVVACHCIAGMDAIASLTLTPPRSTSHLLAHPRTTDSAASAVRAPWRRRNQRRLLERLGQRAIAPVEAGPHSLVAWLFVLANEKSPVAIPRNST